MDSLESIYKNYMNDLYLYLFQLSGNSQTAEDLVQDVFLKAYEHLDSFRGDSIRPWLFRAAYNSYIDRYRKEKRSTLTEPRIINTLNRGQESSPEAKYLIKEKLKLWLETVNSLPEKQRQVILLRDNHELTYQEISQVLSLSISNVKVLLYRARQTVKEVIKDELQRI